MKDRKRFFYKLPLYDPHQIEEKLTEMASEGWMLERLGYYSSLYRKIEPTTLRFSVTYFPKASSFDGIPAEDEQQKIHFCAVGSWKLVDRLDRMQVYYTEQADAVPIETDPVVQLETMYRCIKKNSATQIPILLLAIFQIFNLTTMFHQDPISFLSDSFSFYLPFLWFSILILECCNLLRIPLWHKKAKRAAEQHGTLLPLKENKIIVAATLVVLALTILVLFTGKNLPSFWILLCVGIITLITLVLQGLKSSLRDAQTSRTTNKIVIFSAVIILTAISTLVFTSVIFSSFTHSAHDTKVDKSCTIDGVKYDDCSEPQPIKAKDALSLNGEWYYAEEQQQTFLLSLKTFNQRLVTDERRDYNLDISVTDIKIPMFIPYIREKALVKRDYTFQAFDNFYQPLDAQSYGVEQVYQLYYESEASGTYYIFSGNKLSKIRFSDDYSKDQEDAFLKAYCATLTA